jgi:menaquinol-cytochrome c reductase iron-sulfur subunit
MPNRRKFLTTLSTAATGLLAVAVGGPAIVAWLDPARRITVKGSGPCAYGPLKELPLGVPRKVDVVNERIDAWDRSEAQPVGAVWLVRRDAGRLDAYSATCPHLGCSVGFDEQRKVFICPCHVSAFALADGVRLEGPSPRGLDPLPVEVREGIVHVTYKRFMQGVAARREL